MNIALLVLAIILSPQILGSAQTDPVWLYSTLLSAGPMPDLSLLAIPDSLLGPLGDYRERFNSFEPQAPSPDTLEPPLRWIAEKRHALERGMTALLGEEVQPHATAFAESCLLCYEWEGMSDCPLEEAQCAEAYLEATPESPLEPCVLLFVAHRLRAAAECLEAEGDDPGAAIVRQRAQASLAGAGRSAIPLVRYMSDELARVPSVYLRSR